MTEWMIANWILTALGAIGGLPILIAGILYMFKHLFPLKITPLEIARYEYDNSRREYIIVVPKVEIHVRRPITIDRKCIEFENRRYCYPSVDWALGENHERLKETEICNMRFTTEIYDEEKKAKNFIR